MVLSTMIIDYDDNDDDDFIDCVLTMLMMVIMLNVPFSSHVSRFGSTGCMGFADVFAICVSINRHRSLGNQAFRFHTEVAVVINKCMDHRPVRSRRSPTKSSRMDPSPQPRMDPSPRRERRKY